MTNEQLLAVPCKHGNFPKLIKIDEDMWRSVCVECKCGSRSLPEHSPRRAATRWHRSHHSNS